MPVLPSQTHHLAATATAPASKCYESRRKLCYDVVGKGGHSSRESLFRDSDSLTLFLGPRHWQCTKFEEVKGGQDWCGGRRAKAGPITHNPAGTGGGAGALDSRPRLPTLCNAPCPASSFSHLPPSLCPPPPGPTSLHKAVGHRPSTSAFYTTSLCPVHFKRAPRSPGLLHLPRRGCLSL